MRAGPSKKIASNLKLIVFDIILFNATLHKKVYYCLTLLVMFWNKFYLNRIGFIILEVSVQLLQLQRGLFVLRLDPVSDGGSGHQVTVNAGGSISAVAAGSHVWQISASGV